MPVYEFVCPEGHRFDKVLKVADYQVPQACECGYYGKRVISAPMVFVSPEIRYTSPIDGKVITNRQQRQDDLARNGCIPYDPEMKKDTARKIEREQRQLEATVDAAVERQIHDMPTRKREKLAAELQGGLSAEVIRTTLGA